MAVGPKTCIDTALRFYDNIDPDDGDNTSRRARLLSFLQHVYEYIHGYREWEWTFTETAVNISAGQNSVALPTTFLEFGRNGGLYEVSSKTRLFEISRQELEQLRQRGSTDTGVFSIFSGKIQVPGTGARSFTAFHRVVAETLVDDDTAFLMPAKYINTVLIPALVYRVQQSKQDARDDWSGQFREGLSQMCALENPMKTSAQRMPLAMRGVW